MSLWTKYNSCLLPNSITPLLKLLSPATHSFCCWLPWPYHWPFAFLSLCWAWCLGTSSVSLQVVREPDGKQRGRVAWGVHTDGVGVQCRAPGLQGGWLVGVRFPDDIEQGGRSSRNAVERGMAIPRQCLSRPCA